MRLTIVEAENIPALLYQKNINNRRLIEHHVTYQIIRSEVKRTLENQTQVLQYQSLPTDLVLDTSGDLSPACNRVTLGSSDIIIDSLATVPGEHN